MRDKNEETRLYHLMISTTSTSIKNIQSDFSKIIVHVLSKQNVRGTAIGNFSQPTITEFQTTKIFKQSLYCSI